MWKYIVYGSIVSSVLIKCPDKEYGFECDTVHEKKVATDFKGEFWLRKNAVRYMELKESEGAKNLELDSLKID